MRYAIAAAIAVFGAVCRADGDASLPFDVLDYRIAADYGFDGLSNPSGRVKDCAELLTGDLACFSGEYLRMPTNSTGIIQISVSENIGYLEYEASGDFEADMLYVRARKRNASPDKWLMYVDDVCDGATNELGVVDITLDFEWYAFALDGLKAGERLVLHQDLGISSRRIILIDRIIFARKKKHGFYIIIR